MNILGISEIDNDSGAALFLEGELFAAANEERFSRRKLHAGFPHLAISWMLKKARLKARDLDAVVIVKPEPERELELDRAALAGYGWLEGGAPISRRLMNWLTFRAYRGPRRRREVRRMGRQIAEWIDSAGLSRDRIIRAHHHRSHAASGFFASGFDRALAVTCDGQGGGVTASAYSCAGSTMDLVHEVKSPDSMGFFYAMVTRALGFRPARHEGKVTGLAGLAPPDPSALALFRDLARSLGGSFETRGVYGALLETRRLAAKVGREGVAAAAQAVLEEVITSYVRHHLEATGETGVVLAGGVFANVKLNQRICEVPGVERVFVFPHMGDGGLGYGGAVNLLAELQGRKSTAVTDVYWGPEWSDGDMEAILVRHGVEYRFVPELEREVARALCAGKTVARFAGRMEFGPRALGNRSVLHAATDPAANDWLNRRLGRSEFMPFAPVVLFEDAPLLFERMEAGKRAAEFMTVTFDCTKTMRDLAPAVVHADGTARPQVIREEVNPSYYAIVDEYRRTTGLPALINTSFNLHEEPIVNSPEDAIRTFRQAELDLLALGPFLCKRRE